MVSLKENAGTIITRDKRRAAGSRTRICPSNHGKHKSLQRAPWGRKSFASSSQCCCQALSTSPRGHRRVYDSLFPEQPWVSVLQTRFCFLPLCLVHRASQTPSCLSQLPNRFEAKTCLWFLCGSCARRDGLGASLLSSGQGRKSRAELTACKRFLSFYPAVILRLIAPLPHALIFSTLPRLPGPLGEVPCQPERFGGSLISAAISRCPSPRPSVSLSQDGEGKEGCASPGCCPREGSPAFTSPLML